MNTLALKNQTKLVNYEKNLRELLGWKDLETKILRKSAGMLKGVLKKSGVAYQKDARKKWESRVKKLEKKTKK